MAGSDSQALASCAKTMILENVQTTRVGGFHRTSEIALAAALVVALAAGCASVRDRVPVPEELSDVAQVPGIPNAKFWGDGLPPNLDENLAKMKERLAAAGPGAGVRSGSYLAISGGGANGAFGAGVLLGWTEAGDRPSFDLVTGISTGALTAPFAFLGPDYDHVIKKIYTTVSTDDILLKRGMIEGLTGDAMFSSDPLKKLIAEYVDEEVMKAIAAEHMKGRTLLVGTTHLDAGRPVIWRIDTIAASGAPNALELIRSVLLASASIPCAFPPVFIEVEANGELYDEIHVDGGTASQVFLYPAALDWGRVVEALDIKGEQRIYVLRNSQLRPRWKTVTPRLAQIVGSTISTLIKTQGVGDLYRIYLGAQRDQLDYNLAYIPSDFNEQQKEAFDPEYMQRLFDLGYEMAKSGYPWDKAPPGMTPP